MELLSLLELIFAIIGVVFVVVKVEGYCQSKGAAYIIKNYCWYAFGIAWCIALIWAMGQGFKKFGALGGFGIGMTSFFVSLIVINYVFKRSSQKHKAENQKE